MPWDLTDGTSTLVLTMAWGRRQQTNLPAPVLAKFYDPKWGQRINTLRPRQNARHILKAISLNSSPPSVAYMRQWFRVIIGSDNGLSPIRRQAIFWTNDGILLIRTIGTNSNEILSKIHTFSFKKMRLKMSSAKWRPCCLGLNVLMKTDVFWPKFHWNLFPKVQLTIRHHRFIHWLGAIIWANGGMGHWRIYASLDPNELTHLSLNKLNILQMPFSNAVPSNKTCGFPMEFHWSSNRI